MSIEPEPNPTEHRPGVRAGARAARWTAAAAAVVVALVVVLVIVAAAVVLKSARFHDYALGALETEAGNRLGTQVQLQNFTVHPSRLSVDLYGLTVYGANPYRNPPLLQVAHIGVGIRVVSVLHRKWYLDNLRIDRPVVKVFTDSKARSNIPTVKSSGGSTTSVFDIGIRHAVLDGGEAYYNDQQSDIDADLRDLDFHSTFDPGQQKYSGAFDYRDGRLRAGSFNPVPHALQVQFDATPSSFHLTRATLISGSSRFDLTATLADYGHPKVQGRYDAVLDGAQIGQILRNPSVPEGVIRASGSVAYQDNPNQPFLNDLALDGELSSGRLDLRSSSLRLSTGGVLARYWLKDGNAAVEGLRVGLLGGLLTGALQAHDLSGNSRFLLQASLKGISVADLRRLAPASASTKGIVLSGVLNAEANAAWRANLNGLVAHADAQIHASTARAGMAKPPLPIEGLIHATYTAQGQQIAIAHSYLRMPGAALTVNGSVSNRSNLAIQFNSSDLSELETIADIVSPPASGHPALALAGTASFQGSLRGTAAAPHLQGQLVASELHLEGTAWKVLRTGIEVSPASASLENADLEPASGGRISINASAGLKKWSFTSVSPVSLDLHASQLNVADLAKLAAPGTPMQGTLTADVQVRGTELSPVGQGTITLAHAEIENERVQLVKVSFTGTGDEVRGTLNANLPAGALEGAVTFRPKQKSYTAQLTAHGLRLDRLQLLKASNVTANGVLNLNASGQGTFDDPQGTATFAIPQLQIEQQTITGISLRLAVAQHVATASLESQAVNTSIRGEAKVALTGDYLASASLDTQAIPLKPLLAMYAPEEAGEVSGETELHATLRGPLKEKAQLEAHITIPTLKLAYSNTVQLAAVEPIHVDYVNGVITLARTAVRGTDTDLQLQGSVPIQGHGPMSLLLLGTVNLQLAQLFDPDVTSSGELRFNIGSQGQGSGPNLEGQVNIVDANFTSSDLPLGLQHGNGVLTVTNDRINLTRFQGAVGGGTLAVQGGVSYRPSVQFDLAAALHGVRMLYPQGIREGVSADLKLTGSPSDALLGGQVHIDDLSFTPAFDLTNFIGQLSGGVAAPPSQGFSQDLHLNLAVNSTNDVNLVSRTLSLNGAANLQVRGTAAQPVILGRVNLSDGDLIFNGDRFVLTGGTVEFVNPYETQPVVNLSLSTTIQQYNISLRFNGPVDQLSTNYASDPSLPAADIINLLAFGQTTEANAANPSTPANQAAESLIASQVSSQVTSRISKIAGISQLSINPVLSGGSSQGPAGATIAVQQRVTGNFFVTFSTNVATTQDQTIMGQYQISPRVAVTGTRDENGGFAFDTILKKTW